jgi:hypothetical protein
MDGRKSFENFSPSKMQNPEVCNVLEIFPAVRTVF